MSATILRRADAASARSWASAELPDVSAIVAEVQRGGDAALAAIAQRFGDPQPRRITRDEMRAAYDSLDAALQTSLQRMRARIETFARAQRSALGDVSVDIDGIICGHRAIPVETAAVYVPGGRYPLPSSLLMGVVPAQVAGVPRIVVASPSASRETLAAAHVAGVEEFHLLGGAQAIAALAYGTASIAPVDLIVGPGNAYVTAAKRAVYGVCGIDALAGPSEVAVVASNDANPRVIAADLLAQAEHDADARPILIAESEALAQAVEDELRVQLPKLATSAVAKASLECNGRCIIASPSEAVRIADLLAPEHLELHGSAAVARANEFRTYGALFIGEDAAEVFGDYGAGPNHVLPTGGSARYTAGLSVMTFLNLRTYQRARELSEEMIDDTARIAACEGLDGHRAAAVARARVGDARLA